MKKCAQFGRMVVIVVVFGMGFFAVFPEGAKACSFSPSKITSSMQGSAARKTTINCQSPGKITCSVSGSLTISPLNNHACTGVPPNHGRVFAPLDDQAGSVSCTITGGTSEDGSCSLTVEKYGASSSTCKGTCREKTCLTGEKEESTDCSAECKKKDSKNTISCISEGGNGGTAGTTVNISLVNPLKYSTVQEVLSALLSALQGVIVVLSLVFIVIGAVLYITSTGNQARVTMAKGAITAALIGLSIGILAPTFLKEIATVLGWSSTLPADVSGAKSASDILLSVLNFLLGIVGILAIIMLVIGGIMFLTAAGSQDRIGTAKKIISSSLLGIVVALAALVIVRQIASFFAGA